MKISKNIKVILILLLVIISIIIFYFNKDMIDKNLMSLLIASTIIGIISTIYNISIKIQAEIRLKESTQAEIDAKMLNLFTDLMDIAHSRKSHIVSEKLIEEMFDKNILTIDDFKDIDIIDNLKNLNEKLKLATRAIPVGLAAQNAAIVSIKELAKRYKILEEPAMVGLKSLKEQDINVELVESCIVDLQNRLTK